MSSSAPQPLAPNRNLLWCGILVEELLRCGVEMACIAPGSRSAPIALALAEQVPCTVHIDERSAAFFALGAARQSRTPVAVVCSSGTAVANFLPAAIEASQSGVPLIFLTGDRPPELHQCAAPQAIEQNGIFGSFLRASFQLPLPEVEGLVLRSLRAAICRLVQASQKGFPGPVHVNIPLRDPLDPRSVPRDQQKRRELDDLCALQGRPGRPFSGMLPEFPKLDPASLQPLLQSLGQASAPLIVAGPQSLYPRLPTALLALAQKLQAPVLADPVSQLRRPATRNTLLMGAQDSFLRSEGFRKRHKPDLVLRFGAPPTSKVLNRYLAESNHAEQWLLGLEPGIPDPAHLGSLQLYSDPTWIAEQLTKHSKPPGKPSTLLAPFQQAESIAQRLLAESAEKEAFEATVVRALAAALPENSLLYVGNSMPIRELDSFLEAGGSQLEILANRGANGIDGLVSSAFGALAARRAAGNEKPGVLLLGDLSLLHDVGGFLPAARYDLPLVTVVLNNDGGGIFSYLPIHGQSPLFEPLFGTPHGLDLEPVARLYKMHWKRTGPATFHQALREALTLNAPCLLEVQLDREASLALHRSVWKNVESSVKEL